MHHRSSAAGTVGDACSHLRLFAVEVAEHRILVLERGGWCSYIDVLIPRTSATGSLSSLAARVRRGRTHSTSWSAHRSGCGANRHPMEAPLAAWLGESLGCPKFCHHTVPCLSVAVLTACTDIGHIASGTKRLESLVSEDVFPANPWGAAARQLETRRRPPIPIYGFRFELGPLPPMSNVPTCVVPSLE